MQYENLINKLIDLGIEEDINTGDITTESIIPESTNATATMTAKQDGVISGLEIVKMVYERFQEDVIFTPYYKFKNNFVTAKTQYFQGFYGIGYKNTELHEIFSYME